MAEVGSINIIVSATDAASGVISSVASSVAALSDAQGNAASGSRAVDAAMRGNAREAETYGAATERTRARVESLQTSLRNQERETRSASVTLRDSTAALSEKQAAVKEAARAYRANTASLNENNENLKYQLKLLDGTTENNKNRIAALRESNRSLSRNSAEYKSNQEAIKSLSAENKQMRNERGSITAAIRENDEALRSETQAYRRAQEEVRAAAANHRTARENVARSREAERQYADEINRTNAALSGRNEISGKTKGARTELDIDAAESRAAAAEREAREAQREQRAQQHKETRERLNQLGEGIDQATKPVQHLSMALAAGGVAAAKFALDWEDDFAAVKKTVDGTPEQLNAVRQSILDMATVGVNGHGAIPLTTSELSELAAAGGQVGIATENITGFTETMAMMGTATNLTGEQGAATLARFQNVMQISQGEIGNVASAIVDLGNNSATTEAEIANMALRMGKYGQTVGMSAADVLGYSAAMSSMGIEAQLGGSAVGRTWASIEKAVAKGGKDLETFAKYSGKSAEEFADQWNTDTAGAFNGLLEGLSAAENLTLALDDIGINNTQDIQAMQALVNGIDLVKSSVERANTAYRENTALQEEFNAKQETTASQLAVTKNNLVEAARSIGEVFLPTIKNGSDTVNAFAQKIAGMSDSEKQRLVNVAGGITAVGMAARVLPAGIKMITGVGEGISQIAESATALSGIFPGLGGAGMTALGAIAVPAGVVAGYHVLAEHVTEAIDNNTKLGQSYKQEFDAWSEADDRAKHIAALRDEYEQLNEAVSGGSLSHSDLEEAKQRISDIMSEIKSLVSDEDIKLMIDTGDFESALTLAVSDAQEAADSIREAFDLDNPKKGKKALEKAYKGISENTAKLETFEKKQKTMSAWLTEAAEYKDQYKAILDEIDAAGRIEDKTERKAAKKAANDRLESFKTALKDSGFTQTYKDLLGRDFEFGDTKRFREQIQNVREECGDLQDQASASNERLNESRKSLEAMAQAAQDSALKMMGFNDTQEAFSEGGAAVEKVAKEMNEQMQDLGFHSEDIAKQTALFRNGFESMEQAASSGALDSFGKDFVNEGHKLGMSAEDIKTSLEGLGFTTSDTAAAFALSASGVSSLNDAWDKGGETLDRVVSDYISNMEQFGAGAEDTAVTAALMANGFRTAEEAAAKGSDAITGVLQDIQKYGQDLGIDTGQESLTKLAQAIGLIPDTKLIEITADGIEVIDDLENVNSAVEKLNGAGGKVKLNVEADGDISVVETADEKLRQLAANGDVTIQLSAEGDGFDILNGGGEKIGTITAKGKIEWEETDTPEVEDATQTVNQVEGEKVDAEVEDATQTVNQVEGDKVDAEVKTQTVNYIGNFDGVGEAPSRDGVAKYAGDFNGVGTPPTLHGTVIYEAKYTKQAKGSDNFPGGLAMVNDQKGVSDPRELIEHKGQYMMFEGRDVIVPLDKGDKVYTAAQTKRMLSGQIPHFAEGRKNSDAFTSAKEETVHYTKTHALSLTQELERWIELQKKFNSEEKDRWDIEEEIFALNQKITNELNKQAEAYVEERNALNDWDEWGDNAIAAFRRVRERNYAEVAAQRMTWEDFSDQMKSFGSKMYDDRRKHSEKWLRHEEKYNFMAKEDYIAGLDRMREYTEEYYAQGIINHQKYVESLIEIDEERIDKARELLEEQNELSLKYTEDRTALNDWEKYGDDPWRAFGDVKDRNYSAAQRGEISWDEAGDNAHDFGKAMYDGMQAQSEKWLEHERKYHNLSVEDYLAGIGRMRDRTQEFYDKGAINEREYLEEIAKYDDMYVDGRKEQLEELMELSKAYMDEHTYFNDWDDNGDDPLRAYQRVYDRNRAALEAGELTQKEFDDYMSSLGSDMFNGRFDQSKNWLEEQRKYYNMSAEDYAAGIERMKEYTDEYYRRGLIDRRAYNEAMTELNHMALDEAQEQYEDMLKRQSDYISELREQFSKEEKELRDSWDETDRAIDMRDVRRQMEAYSGAVTEKGMQKYRDLEKQLRDLERDEYMAELQERNTATIEKLEAEYKSMEESKASMIATMAAKIESVDISGIVGGFERTIASSGNTTNSLLMQLISAIEKKEFTGPVQPTTKYSDDRKINNYYTINGSRGRSFREFISVIGR